MTREWDKWNEFGITKFLSKKQLKDVRGVFTEKVIQGKPEQGPFGCARVSRTELLHQDKCAHYAFVMTLSEAETVLGQSIFGHPYLTTFGQNQFWPIHFWPKLSSVLVVSQSVRPRRVGAPKFVGPEGVGAPKGGEPKISRFFFSPATIFFLSSLSWGSFR